MNWAGRPGIGGLYSLPVPPAAQFQTLRHANGGGRMNSTLQMHSVRLGGRIYSASSVKSGISLAGLVAGEHCPDKALFVQATGNNHAGNMEENKQ